MEGDTPSTAYQNISQRVADTFGRMLAQPGTGRLTDVHAFFSELYSELYAHPERFGLPLSEDTCIAENEPDPKEKKQAVKRQLDKPRDMIMAGLDFLQRAGAQGHLDGSALVLDGYAAVLKETKINKRFLEGLKGLGLAVTLNGDSARLEHGRLPGLAAGLQALAQGSAAYKNLETGKFQFARCDPRALSQVEPDPAEIYRCFDGQEQDRVMELHRYFSEKGYQTSVEVNGALAWAVKYQGSRKVKSTPFFQVDRDDRHARPLRLQIKCASAHRIASLIPSQPDWLRADFWQRTFQCKGDQCGWCRNKKGFGPCELDMDGQKRTICWYTNPDLRDVDEHTVPLVIQYEQMHAQLVEN